MSYKPINCSFHDLLLDIATRKTITHIVYKEKNITHEYKGQIIDVFTKNGEEFLKAEGNILMRLDQILQVDSHQNI